MNIDKLIKECEWLYNDYEKRFPTSKALNLFNNNESIFMSFLNSPASSIYHGNFVQGLFCHSIKVTERALQIREHFNVDTIDLVDICLLHDIGKIGKIKDNEVDDAFYKYRYDDEGNIKIYKNKNLPDHTILGLYNIHQLKINLSYDQYMAIAAHNGAYVEDFQRNFTGRETELMMVLHQADLYVSRIVKI